MVQLCNVGVSGDGLRLFPLNIAVFTQVLRIFAYIINYYMKRLFILGFLSFLLLHSIVAQDKVKVACIGNSVTYGFKHEKPEETSYPVQLGRMLGDEYDVRNFGHSGATLLNKGHRPYTQQAVYNKVIEFVPDIAIIHLGLNDTDPRNWPNYRDEFIPDYISLIDTLRSLNPDVKVWVCRMTPIFHWHPRFKSGTRDWFWQIQEAIEQVAETANVGLIDLHESLYSRPDLMPDALHPDPAGATLIANKVYSAITNDCGGLSLPAIYSDNMVIQRDAPFVVRGTADSSAEVILTLGHQKIRTKAAPDGKWVAEFKPLKADGKEYTLTVKSGSKEIEFNNIAVGEVWLCSGQSNMEWMLNRFSNCDKYCAEAATKNIRLYDMKARVITDNVGWSIEDLENINNHNYYIPTEWQPINSNNAASFSAVAYHFGAMLADSLGVPVGLICNAIGGAPAEAFIDRKTLEHNHQLVEILYNWRNNDMIQDWCRGRASENLKNATNSLQRHPYEPCFLYETGVAPLVGYPIKGAIWYQGESNAHNVELHESIFPVLLESWRNAWGYEFPFYFVQLSSINRPSWPHFRDSQRRLADRLSNCAMAVSSDKGHPTNVHPDGKQFVGERLARQALYRTYNCKNVVPSGPVVRSAERKGSKVILNFDWADGLSTSDGEPVRTFEIADSNGLFYAADKVVIKDSTIIISSKKVKSPVSLRYGWQPYTTANIVNGEGLPLSTFVIDIK